jgi:hypothetical protein
MAAPHPWKENQVMTTHIEVVGAERKIILKLMFKRQSWTAFMWLRLEPSSKFF